MAQMLIAPTDQLTDERLPVGGVTDGIEVQLLGPDGEPVKTDEVGEIVVHGDHLSPGYWGDERLTAERFMTVNGRRCYRTGDLARRRQDGALTVIGRTDSQVKIRGHGVQLGGDRVRTGSTTRRGGRSGDRHAQRPRRCQPDRIRE